jgi:hypothetical protein
MGKYILDFGPATPSGLPTFETFRNIDTDEDLTAVAPVLTEVATGAFQFNWNSGIILQFRAVIGSSYVPGLIDQTDGDPRNGEGSVRVDHDYGGTDALQILETGGSPLNDAFIYAYKSEDYVAGRTDRPRYAKGQSQTDATGRWVFPMWLDPGTYNLVIVATGHIPSHVALTVT